MVSKVKDEFSKEINQLKFKNANISAFQDLIAEEMRQRKEEDKKNDEGD
jgi:predicted RNA-binding protein